jgi:hypothetical protein
MINYRAELPIVHAWLRQEVVPLEISDAGRLI